MMRALKIVFAVVAGLLVAETAGAQTIDEALRLYKKRNYAEAAFSFYDVMAHDSNPDVRDQAEIYLAETLRKMHLLVPALYYYKDIMLAGRQNRYYLNAVEGLLAVQRELHDPLFVPSLINNNLDVEGFGQLDPDKIAHVNYMIGELSFRQRKNQDARAFLKFVPPESPLHPKARYLLGIIDIRDNNPDDAIAHFRYILDAIDPDSSNDEHVRVRNLAMVSTGRAYYGTRRYAEATRYYKGVPRFTEQWFTAMYENAWAYFQRGEYGKSLGELSSVTAPYFSKRHVPEAYVIRGTTYFANCQWDRVRKAVGNYKKVYEPMLTGLEAYIEGERAAPEYYEDVATGGGGRFSIELAREVRRTKRFRDYHFMLEHMKWERSEVKRVKVWRGSRLSEDLTDIVEQHNEELASAVGKWTRLQLRKRLANLKHFQTQIDILDFEVADAERQWLEQGKEILKGRRARLPRPEIPNDQWQHWNFDREYWKDELGYIEHSLACECLTKEECEAIKAGAEEEAGG